MRLTVEFVELSSPNIPSGMFDLLTSAEFLASQVLGTVAQSSSCREGQRVRKEGGQRGELEISASAKCTYFFWHLTGGRDEIYLGAQPS